MGKATNFEAEAGYRKSRFDVRTRQWKFKLVAGNEGAYSRYNRKVVMKSQRFGVAV